MIEDLPALAEIDAIAATQLIDIVAVGPSDMSRALGVGVHADHPKLVEDIDRLADGGRRAAWRGSRAHEPRRAPAERGAAPRARRGLRQLRSRAGGTDARPMQTQVAEAGAGS